MHLKTNINIKSIYAIIVLLILLNLNIINLENKLILTRGSNGLEHITLGLYEYHSIAINATSGQTLSGSWEVTPADFVSPPFLVFIIDSANFEEWKNSDNLTQAISRFPSDSLIYLYDPLFRLDDIIGDFYRTDTIQVKVPYEDTWYFVMYSGASILLTFGWYVSPVDSRIVDIVIYSLLGIIGIGIIVIFTVVTLKRRKISPEEEFEQILKEHEEEKTKGLGSLEDLDEEEFQE
ncbi:MAG: hypothetical protein EAX90_08635 [Candidatus Heimdallarchaeota archaeon]|nr:hypothetical protein [Candidatus Heimdallarchaeota archaeon]